MQFMVQKPAQDSIPALERNTFVEQPRPAALAMPASSNAASRARIAIARGICTPVPLSRGSWRRKRLGSDVLA
jgi:hypothetical protein